MRGAPYSVIISSTVNRIIPADAGSTVCLGLGFVLTADHPRGCGEHVVITHDGGSFQGSSPRMRGALSDRFNGEHFLGIIPADAGSTDKGDTGDPGSRDHPRGCGEHQGGISHDG